MSSAENSFDIIFQKQGANDSSLAIQASASPYPKLTKLKIVGNGMNSWSVATTFPFYLIDPEPILSVTGNNLTENQAQATPTVSQPLTGATNLITHYGLLSTYHKFCGKPFKETLGSFLPSIPGKLDTPASVDDSGLMNLLRKPPVQKEIAPFQVNSMNEAFKVYKNKITDHMHLFCSETPNLVPSEEKSKHKSENRKRKRRDSTMTPKPLSTTGGLGDQSSGMMGGQSSLLSDGLNGPDCQSSLGGPGASSSAQYTPKSSVASISDGPSGLTKVPSSATIFSSSQTQSPAMITPFTIKTKKSKKSDDEKKKKKKEKKKKKDRMLD